MAYDKFLIAPITGGQQKNVRPWLIMDEAFEKLRNMYVWRGRIKKRFGSSFMNTSIENDDQQLFSRLRVLIGATDVSGNLSVTVPGGIYEIGQLFSCYNESEDYYDYYTVTEEGTPGDLLVSSVSGATGTYNTDTGLVEIFGGPAEADVYFYPALPVMNFYSYYDTIQNSEITFAFDTRFVYRYSYSNGWQRETDGTPEWSGTDKDFYYACNYRGLDADIFNLFVVNYVVDDYIWYYDGATWSQVTGFDTNATDKIQTSKIIVPFKNRLLMMNTKEEVGGNDKIFPNRIRYSQIGNPLEADAWKDTITGKGGFLDIPNNEAIISVGFIKDRLIIYMEESTWELVDTGNKAYPFVTQQINSELGVDATGSLVPFDKVVLGFGSKGLFSCNGINVDRIDQLIPQTIFEVSNINNGPERVAGIRDYYNELAYWSYNSTENSDVNSESYPNTVLVYDYVNGTWAYNDDSITAFGYYLIEQNYTWEDLGSTWQDSDLIWRDPSLQANFRSIIAGNQQGFTFLINSALNENAPVQYITNLTYVGRTITITSINHNLPNNSYILINSLDDDGNIKDVIDGFTWKVNTQTANTFTITVNEDLNGDYLGVGTFIRISEIEILTKQYNFYNKIGQNIALSRVDFLVDKTEHGQVAVDFICSTSENNLYEDSLVSGAAMGTNILETSPYASIPLEQSQSRFWHYVYFQAQGENVQLRIYYNGAQVENPNITSSDIEIGAMLFYVTKTSSNFGG